MSDARPEEKTTPTPTDEALDCRFCDYQLVCGPYEELRTGRKWQPPLEPLKKLRSLT